MAKYDSMKQPFLHGNNVGLRCNVGGHIKAKWHALEVSVEYADGNTPDWKAFAQTVQADGADFDEDAGVGIGSYKNIQISFGGRKFLAQAQTGRKKVATICRDLSHLAQKVVAIGGSGARTFLSLKAAADMYVDRAEEGVLHSLSDTSRSKFPLAPHLRLDFVGFKLFIGDPNSKALNIVDITPRSVENNRVICNIETFHSDVSDQNIGAIFETWQSFMEQHLPQLVLERGEQIG
jgi:hypothetical protein